LLYFNLQFVANIRAVKRSLVIANCTSCRLLHVFTTDNLHVDDLKHQ